MYKVDVDETTTILRDEVEEAVRMLKNDKSAAMDNIPAELIKAGGEAMTNALIIRSGHHIKVVLRILLNRLKLLAEQIIAEEQESFRKGRSTTEHYFHYAKTFTTSTPAVSHLHRLQEGIRQSLG